MATRLNLEWTNKHTCWCVFLRDHSPSEWQIASTYLMIKQCSHPDLTSHHWVCLFCWVLWWLSPHATISSSSCTLSASSPTMLPLLSHYEPQLFSIILPSYESRTLQTLIPGVIWLMWMSVKVVVVEHFPTSKFNNCSNKPRITEINRN